jgi:hypothetical protein
MLLNVVRLRYLDIPDFLAAGSVITSMSACEGPLGPGFPFLRAVYSSRYFHCFSILYRYWVLGKQDRQRQLRWSLVRDVLHWVEE